MFRLAPQIYKKNTTNNEVYFIICCIFFQMKIYCRNYLRNILVWCTLEKNYLTMKSSTFLVLFLLFINCSSYKYGENASSNSNLTFGMVKSKIIKGQTTQEEILKTFGSPNLTTKNKSNNEVWSYNRMSVNQKGGETYYLSGAKGSSSSSTKSFDLIISFDDKDIVKDYSVISTNY